ncbi:phosphatase 2C [Thalictrum thalictroides]|uniref:Phosphatase 2C n=1 Tax=Thalictrum thalictroides TaxID=46969 RepID=A0A7J6W9Z3_THATH|nr:phosphatase 2C [Thalictrum thalictroides]
MLILNLINWLEETGKQTESGSTATVMFANNEMLIISHVGDSSVVLSCSGKAEVLTNPHRLYGNNKVSLQEIRRIREAGGWENLYVLHVFSNRVQFKDDLLIASPDIYQVALASDAEFILLASDGLWDYVDRNQLRKHGNVQLACEALAQTALDRRSEDNISIIIADLGGRTNWESLPPQQQNFVWELSQAFGIEL